MRRIKEGFIRFRPDGAIDAELWAETDELTVGEHRTTALGDLSNVALLDAAIEHLTRIRDIKSANADLETINALAKMRK